MTTTTTRRGVVVAVPKTTTTTALTNDAATRGYANAAVTLKEYPPHAVFPMPALSPTMDSGTIARWRLNEGDAFAAGDVLCSIETDKATMDFEAQDDGVLAKILRPAGDESSATAVGTPICVVVDEADDVPAFADYEVTQDDGGGDDGAAAAAANEGTASEASAESAPSPQPPTTASTSPSPLLPSARYLAESRGYDATVLKGSGKGGRVTKGDVLRALRAGTMPPLTQRGEEEDQAAAAPAAPSAAASSSSEDNNKKKKTTLADLVLSPATMSYESTYEDVPNNRMRQIIAQRLTESKATVPHFYTTTEIALDNVLRLRKQWASELDVKVSVNDFILKASALALRDVPAVNASFDAKTDAVRPNGVVDVSVAVATPTGLITPIVFGADRMGLQQLTVTVSDLATRARDGKLAPHEYQGGTFSVSNLGMFGIAEFSAVINPPQAAILYVHHIYHFRCAEYLGRFSWVGHVSQPVLFFFLSSSSHYNKQGRRGRLADGRTGSGRPYRHERAIVGRSTGRR